MQQISIKCDGYYFSSAHHLPNHVRHLCRNIHGHTFQLEFEFHGVINKEFNNIIFLSEVRKKIEEIVLELDHKLILPEGSFSVEDDMAIFYLTDKSLKNRCSVPLYTIFSLPKQESTIELIAEYMLEFVSSYLKENYPNIKSVAIRLYETPNYSTIITKQL